MISKILLDIKNDESRTGRIKKNVIASFAIKGWAGVVQLLLVPATLMCLGNYINGLWMIVVSLLLWIDNMDLGIGNGMRNKVAESIAHEDYEKARSYVSTAFFSIMVFMVVIALVLALLVSSIDVYSLLNIDNAHVSDFEYIFIMSMAVTCVTFIFKLSGNLYLALQLPAVNNAIVVIGQTGILLGIYALWFMHIANLWTVAIAYTAMPLLVNIIAFILTFSWKYKWLSPSLRLFNMEYVKEILYLGCKFFCLQISGMVIFMSTNVIISSLFTPEMVTPYQVAFRLFSLMLTIFMVILTPYWSSTTDAYNRQDYLWIVDSQKRLLKILYGLAACMVAMVLLSSFIYTIWVGSSVDVPLSLSVLMAIYIYEIIYSQTYSAFLNGIGRLKVQLCFTIAAAVLVIPCSIAFGRLLGLNGICLALILVNLPGAIANKIQFNHIFCKKLCNQAS